MKAWKKYTYVAILQSSDDGISIYFPDIDEAYTCALITEEALKDAEEVLRLSLRSRIRDGEELPEPTELKNITTGKNQYTTLV